ncbi:MAG: outer membrane protein assembly factor BamD [Acidobacteria bacterium]|nr:outer membrane protein assembly factor BamD [Acidobacteriota bacterium]
MALNRTWMLRVTVALAVGMLLTSCGLRRKKYENPITKDTQQPDKVLFDKAVKDIERGRYEIARLTLNTLINTYDTSEFLAKAKLAVADSWFREGGAHGLAQAEAEYKDFILFYPTMEEAAESQMRICDIHYKQMEKVDRDPNQALRAEQECRQLLTQFPNSKYAPTAEQRLRNIQEVLAESEMRVAMFYHHKGSFPAAVNRFRVVDQYPLYSGADDALWNQADSYSRMGPRFRTKAGESYSRIVRDYPLSGYADGARKKLKELEMPIPEADPVALNRMKYELENRKKPGMVHTSMSIFRRGPETWTAAKSGSPAMNAMRPTVPDSVPLPAAGGGTSGDISIATTGDAAALEAGKEAREKVPGQAAPAAEGQAAAPAASGTDGKPANGSAQAPLPTNHTPVKAKQKKESKLKLPKLKKSKPKPDATPAAAQPAAPASAK